MLRLHLFLDAAIEKMKSVEYYLDCAIQGKFQINIFFMMAFQFMI